MKNETETLSALLEALAKAQSEMEAAVNDATNPFFKSKYAKLEHVVKASRPYLAKHGLSVLQRTYTDEKNQLFLLTRLGHSSGEWIESNMAINPPKQDIQAIGSYITYLRRYNYSAIVGVVTEDEADDDGEKAKQAVEKEKAQLITDDKVEEIASQVCITLGLENLSSVFEYLKQPHFRKALSTSQNPVENCCSDRFIAGYQKWLEKNSKET